MQRLTTTLVLLAALGGCAEFPGVYKIDVPQGNIITQKMVDQLKPGMSRAQVSYIMGSPLLKDNFNGNRWDYIYSVRSQNNPKPERRMSLYFAGDNLTHFTGTVVPGGSQDTPSEEAPKLPHNAATTSPAEDLDAAPVMDSSNTLPGDKPQGL